MVEKNEGKVDRVVRFILGVVFLIVGLFFVSDIFKIIFIFLSLVSISTSITGFCGIYKLFGINTLKK